MSISAIPNRLPAAGDIAKPRALRTCRYPASVGSPEAAPIEQAAVAALLEPAADAAADSFASIAAGVASAAPEAPTCRR
ncbi:MAG: hypothetical protein R2716_00320 [Microthrixaceae bacterium]